MAERRSSPYSLAPMDDRLFFPLIALLVAAMIALALVWPQGQGARSPAPLGHAVEAAAPPPAARSKTPSLPQEP